VIPVDTALRKLEREGRLMRVGMLGADFRVKVDGKGQDRALDVDGSDRRFVAAARRNEERVVRREGRCRGSQYPPTAVIVHTKPPRW
jgi:hypothetical protein